MKKGNTAMDIILLGVVVFIIGLGYFASYHGFNQAIDQLQNNSEVNSSNATMEVLNSTANTTAKMDYVIFGIFVGLVLAIIISGWFISGNPVFMFIYFLIIVIGIVLATVLANTWEDVTANAIFGTSINAFPITNHLILNLPYYLAIVGFVGVIAMFVRPQVVS